jgi:glycosyltransferase involved in cell wall biosynthesis
VLDRNLVMLGPIPKSEVPAYFGACDLAVSTTIDLPRLGPNVGDNSANKVFDAFAAGRPVAVNHGGSLADILARSGAGLVLPPDDPQAAAAAVSGLLGDKAACEAARAAARGLAQERFSRDLLFAEFERVLSAAGRTPAGAPHGAASGSPR